MNFKKYKYFLYIFFAFYFVAALLAGFTESGEIFPLFSGHWFYKTPTEFNDYGILIYSLDGQLLDTPIYLEKMYSHFQVWPFAAYGAIQQWGRSTERSSSDQKLHKDSVQKLIFGSKKYKIQLVKRRFNSVAFLRDNQLLDAKVLLDAEN